ncbi:glycosyltransferase [Rhodococcus sp. IEGM 1366]|uniref:glycosyltransferase n=1 Tax=Rhodococcus sp. IEGM 1366 TaxID=3082223 RepID=UPI0029549A46|nr:glycosyltransferase [Rhodococcus sp. IEGM 1366]MDV8069616.1 glycosyltransferase [Rhodococcus sp. IEGM 1366]
MTFKIIRSIKKHISSRTRGELEDFNRSIVFLNVTNLDYPRNKALRAVFERAGWDVSVVARRDGISYPIRCVHILLDGLRSTKRKSVVVMSEFGNSYSWVSKLVCICTRSVHVVDGFIGMYETHVEDRATYSKFSLPSIFYKLSDYVSISFSDLYLIDTEVRSAAIQSKYPKARVLSIPVGSPSWDISAEWRKDPGLIRILYYGNYTRLHSVESLLVQLPQVRLKAKISLTLIGDLDLAPHIKPLISDLQLDDCVEFIGKVRQDDLPLYIERSDVVVGIFGVSNKAQSVIANKVWQGLCCGRYVITQESIALDEIRKIAGPLLRTICRPGSDEIGDILVEIAGGPPPGQSVVDNISKSLSTYALEGQSNLVAEVSALCVLPRKTLRAH